MKEIEPKALILNNLFDRFLHYDLDTHTYIIYTYN